MSKPLHQNAAADAFVAGGNPSTHAALTFADGFAWSYAEPIAVLAGPTRVWITTGRFSVTTSKHTGMIRRAAERAGMEVVEKEHGHIRACAFRLAQDRPGPRGRHHDVPFGDRLAAA